MLCTYLMQGEGMYTSYNTTWVYKINVRIHELAIIFRCWNTKQICNSLNKISTLEQPRYVTCHMCNKICTELYMDNFNDMYMVFQINRHWASIIPRKQKMTSSLLTT